MKKYIRSNETIDFIKLKGLDLESEIKELGEIFDNEFGPDIDEEEDLRESKLDFVSAHIYQMIRDISYEDVFELVNNEL